MSKQDIPMTPEEFWSILYNQSAPKPVFYRVYYNNDGDVICYSMEELPHNYIELTAEQYQASPTNAKVIDCQLVVIKPKKIISKLTPSTERGTPCCSEDVSIVVNESTTHTKWMIKTYETNN